MDFIRHYDSPLGPITLASDGEALTGLWFDGQKHFACTLDEDRAEAALPVFEQAEKWLQLYFRGRDPGFTPPLRPRLTPFQQMVSDIMLTISYGHTTSYGQIAAQIEAQRGTRTSARAVGGAVGRNPISLIIPCHRVVGQTGSLTGYAGGLERKIALLRLEGSEV